jgi:cytochrome c556
MRTFSIVTLISVLLLLCNSCAKQQPQTQQLAEYRTTATVKDIMDSMVDPGADYIWEAVETVVSAKGVEEKAPRTDEEWKDVRRRAIMLMEATNLLQIPGRHVARPGEKAEDPKVELAPEQIEDMINKDRPAWIKYAHALHDATMEAFKAIEAKDKDKLLDVGNDIDEACEKCHLQYWYPNENKPESAPSQREKTNSKS